MNRTTPRIAVRAAPNALHNETLTLAQRLGLQVVDRIDAAIDFVLELAPIDSAPGYRLQLAQTGADAPGPISVEFVGGKTRYRMTHEGRKQPLARAAGLKHGANPNVLDATAGLGRDAFVLASLGCTITLLERSPIVAALLVNGVERASADPRMHGIATRMRVIHADACDYLKSLSAMEHPDVIYLDPMYPERSKTALVKKEMRVLRALNGDDVDAHELLNVARTVARRRVVVKRPRGAPTLDATRPSMVIESPNTRYDVYLRNV